jgi:hypothetical protein
MKSIAKIFALAALALTIVPPACVFIAGVTSNELGAGALDPRVGAEKSARGPAEGVMSESLMRGSMATGAVLWFLAAPKWIKKDH